MKPVREAYHKRYEGILLDYMTQGYSLEATLAILKISRETFDKWVEEIPSFATVVEQGHYRRQKFWEDKLLDTVNNPGKDSKDTLIMKTLQNQFDWQPTQKIEHNSSGFTINVSFIDPDNNE